MLNILKIMHSLQCNFLINKYMENSHSGTLRKKKITTYVHIIVTIFMALFLYIKINWK